MDPLSYSILYCCNSTHTVQMCLSRMMFYNKACFKYHAADISKYSDIKMYGISWKLYELYKLLPLVNCCNLTWTSFQVYGDPFLNFWHFHTVWILHKNQNLWNPAHLIVGTVKVNKINLMGHKNHVKFPQNVKLKGCIKFSVNF